MAVAELTPKTDDIIAPSREMSVIENSLKLLESYASLEKIYSEQSLSTNADCDTTHILAIVDRAREFTEKRQFYYLNNAVDYAIEEIDRFRNKYSEEGFFLPKDVYITLRKFLKVYRESLVKLDDGLKVLKTIDKYNAHSSKAELKRWAESLEN